MMDKKLIMEAAVGGAAITLLTYLYRGTPSGLVGTVWYGFPLTWVRYLLVGPQYSPWAVDFVGLIADIIIWTVVVAIALFAAKRMKK